MKYDTAIKRTKSCIMLSEISQREKSKYHMISHIWNLTKPNQTPNEQHKIAHGCREEIDGYLKSVGGRWLK